MEEQAEQERSRRKSVAVQLLIVAGILVLLGVFSP